MKKLTLEGKDHLMHVCLPSVEFIFGKWGSESSQENQTSLQLISPSDVKVITH